MPTDDQIEAFRRDGACCIRGLLDAREVELLRKGVEHDLADPGPLAIDKEGFFEDFCRWQELSEYRSIIEQSQTGAVAGALLGSTQVRVFHDHTLVKRPGTTQRTPWHQDQPYYCIDGLQTVSFWIPLDPVPRESTPEFVAGSHAGPWYMPRSFVAGTPMVFEDGDLEEVPEIEADRSKFPIIAWDLAPGDAVAFSMLTLHCAAGSATLRRAFSLRLVGDDVTFAPRPHRTSPPFPGLDDELAAGAPLAAPRFPVIWQRS